MTLHGLTASYMITFMHETEWNGSLVYRYGDNRNE